MTAKNLRSLLARPKVTAVLRSQHSEGQSVTGLAQGVGTTLSPVGGRQNLSSDPQRPAKANNATIHFSVGDTKGIISNKREAAPVCELFSLMMSFNHLGPKIYQRVSVTPCFLGEKPR